MCSRWRVWWGTVVVSAEEVETLRCYYAHRQNTDHLDRIWASEEASPLPRVLLPLLHLLLLWLCLWLRWQLHRGWRPLATCCGVTTHNGKITAAGAVFGWRKGVSRQVVLLWLRLWW